MTDNEIVKALEDTLHRIKGAEQLIVPKLGVENLCNGLQNALDLINRQKAEKEDIKFLYENLKEEHLEIIKAIKYTKSEAYKEFAERSEKELFIKQNKHREHWMETLNRHRGTEAYKDHEWSIDNWLRGYGEAVQDILAINQNFLKELVGEDNG